MNARQTLVLTYVLDRALDCMEGKLTNAKWAVIGKCSADTAMRDINDLLARGVRSTYFFGTQYVPSSIL